MLQRVQSSRPLCRFQPHLGDRNPTTPRTRVQGTERCNQQSGSPIHPGEILADELAELRVTPAALARALHVPSHRIYQLIAGRRAMPADTALRLEQWLGVEAAFWMNLQKSYDLDLAAQQIGEEIKRTVAHRQSPQSGQLTGQPL